mmetsp:Transcript_5423/g.12876  ORF Transcript_5423/g.12876 Transcript_5423/m.12876 type:complete len:205 (-) Transcript_5423:1055-1669(-)
MKCIRLSIYTPITLCIQNRPLISNLLGLQSRTEIVASKTTNLHCHLRSSRKRQAKKTRAKKDRRHKLRQNSLLREPTILWISPFKSYSGNFPARNVLFTSILGNSRTNLTRRASRQVPQVAPREAECRNQSSRNSPMRFLRFKRVSPFTINFRNYRWVAISGSFWIWRSRRRNFGGIKTNGCGDWKSKFWNPQTCKCFKNSLFH